MNQQQTDLAPSSLVTIITETGLEINSSTSQLIKEKFEPFVKEMEQWKEKSEGLVVVDITEKDKMREARIARLALRAVRVDADKVRKALKEDSNRYNKAVQSIYNFIEGKITPLEEHLEQQEKFEEIQLKKEREALKEERLKLVAQYSNDGELFNLGELSQESFDSLYGTIKQAHEAKIAAEAKAKEEAEAKAKAEAEEKERQRAEIERLREEARLMKEKEQALQDLRNKRNYALRQVSYIHDADISTLDEDEFSKLLNEKTDLFKKQQAEAAAEKAKQDAILAKFREEKLKAEAELKAKQDAEDKAKAEAEKEQKLQEEKKNSENIASDKQKMLMFAKELTEIKFPTLKRKDSQKIIDNAKALIDKVVNYVNENTTKLK
jgi:hypothetical protein